MKDLSEEEILEAYEQFDEDHEPYKFKHAKSFQKAGILVGKKTKTNYVGDISKNPLKPRKDLEPNLNVWKYNDKDEKYELKDLNKGKKSTKKGFFAKMFHKEDVALSALEYLEEGLFSNIKNRISGRRKNLELDLGLRSMHHNLNSSNANLKLINHALTKMNKGKGPLSQKEYDKIKTFQKRESAIGHSLLRKSKDLSKTKNYFTGKGRLKEESLDEGLKQKIRKYSGWQKHQLNKKLKPMVNLARNYYKLTNELPDNRTELGRKTEQAFNRLYGNGYYTKYLSGKGLSGSQKSLKRFGDTAKSSDDNYYVKNSKR